MQALPLPELTKRDIERFWSHVARGDIEDCWEWDAGTSTEGYGRFSVATPEGKRFVQATRVVLFLTTGRDDPALCVCHTCDNPRCCNTMHLWPGTYSENNLDAYRKGRMTSPSVYTRGEKSGQAKLTDENVREIKSALKAGERPVPLSRKYGVSLRAITKIRDRETWKHI